MARIQYLHERNSVYYFRRKIPEELRSFYKGNTEIKHSLHTSNYREAKEAALRRTVSTNVQFEMHKKSLKCSPRRDLSFDELKDMAFVWLDEKAKQAEQEITSQYYTVEEHQDIDCHLDEERHVYEDVTNDTALASIQEEMDDFLKQNNIFLDHKKEQYWQFYNMIRACSVKLVKARQSLYQGDYDISHQPQQHSISPISSASQSHITLGELIDEFIRNPKRRGVRESSNQSYRYLGKILDEYIGLQKDITDINRADCKKIRDVLCKIPPNAKKTFPKLSFQSIIQKTEKSQATVLSPTSVKDHMGRLSSLFKFAVEEEYITSNPARNLSYADTRRQNAKNARDPFTIEQLNTLFHQPLYVGCIDDGSNYHKEGEKIIRRSRFWIPLISLWSGMRMTEICQLRTDDIKQEDSIYYIDICLDDGGEKRLKSSNAERRVPLHPELIKIGFIEYWHKISKQKSEALFPDLCVSSSERKYASFRNWFARFHRKSGVKTSKTNFHSFRHCFRDAMREASISQERAYAIGGWSNGNSAGERYGAGVRIKTLHDEISKISYEGLDLSHLYKDPL